MITWDLGRGQIIPDLPTASFLCFCVKQQVQVTVRGVLDQSPADQPSNSTGELHARHSSSTWNTYINHFYYCKLTGITMLRIFHLYFQILYHR